MVELEQYKFTVNQYKEPMKELGVSLALSHKHEQIKELESEMREEGFWNDPDKAQEVTRKVKNLKDTVSAYHALELTLDDVSTMIELGNEENDASVIPDIEELLGEFEIEFDNLKIQTLLSGEYDKNNAIVTLHAGAGGTESCDWAGMLYRMYSKWADSHGFIDTYRASGAGGQHINKTDSAIRITHIPTGVVVQCQNERSQHKNKDKAMQMLKAKLYLIKEQENREKLSDIRGEVSDNGWGNQIRSYVMQPYTMVKDHRTGEETGNVQSVMDGNLDSFMNAYLRWITTPKKA